jgi:hypothetical protein
MLTVDECLALGITGVKGDTLLSKEGYHEYLLGDYTSGIGSSIQSFIWRPIATLPYNAKFKYEINYNTNPLSFTHCKWRPLLGQSAAKPSDDKPVFTQAMADANKASFAFNFAKHLTDISMFNHKCNIDNADSSTLFTQDMVDKGQLPPVGSLCRVNGRVGRCAYIGDGLVVIKHASGEVAYQKSDTSFETEDTQTPKQKAVDEAMEDIDAEADDVANIAGVVERMIAAGYKKGVA